MQMVTNVHSTNQQAYVLASVKETRAEGNVINVARSIISFHGNQAMVRRGQMIPLQSVNVSQSFESYIHHQPKVKPEGATQWYLCATKLFL